jgi:hypothetical protein
MTGATRRRLSGTGAPGATEITGVAVAQRKIATRTEARGETIGRLGGRTTTIESQVGARATTVINGNSHNRSVPR